MSRVGILAAASAALTLLATPLVARADCIEGVTNCCTSQAADAVVIGTIQNPQVVLEAGADAGPPTLAIERVGGTRPEKWGVKVGDVVPIAPDARGARAPDAGARVIAALYYSVGCIQADSGPCESAFGVQTVLDGKPLVCQLPTSEYQVTLSPAEVVDLAFRYDTDCYNDLKRRAGLDEDDEFCPDTRAGCTCETGSGAVATSFMFPLTGVGVAVAALVYGRARRRSLRR